MKTAKGAFLRICGLALYGIVALTARAEWTGAEFVSVAKRLNGESEERTSAFLKRVVNEKPVVSATWRTTALGVYEAYVNGRETEGFLKPGFTHVHKRRLETAADVTGLWACETGATNVLSALVTSGWWRDEITGRRGRDAGFRGVLELVHADGSRRRVVTDGTWLAGYAGPVVDASIFGGETYDARIPRAWMTTGVPPEGFKPTNVCRDYSGDVTPMGGKAVHLREDLAFRPVRAWVWKGVSGESEKAFGRIVTVREYAGDVPMTLARGETLVVDFGQNAAAEPRFTARAARGTKVTLMPAEMLNDGDGLKSRGNDGPEGSVYRANLRAASARAVYTFAGGGAETYLPRFSYFGFRYLSVTATDEVSFERLASVPVTSIAPGAENGTLVTGVPELNRFIENVKWGHYSNYLSVPTDCPQRNERLGWAADTQVFAPAALYLADVAPFLSGWMDDLVDSQHANGAYPSVAPLAQYGNEGRKIGWADAGVVVPWTVWKRTGDLAIVRNHWDSMMRFLRLVDESKYETTPGDYQYADWLSFEPMETCRDRYWTCTNETVLSWWNYLGTCHWRMDALKMGEMARALGDGADAAWCVSSADRAMARLKGMLVDGRLPEAIRTFQSANLFALKLGVFDNPARAAEAKATLLASFRDNGNRLKTGFVSTAILMDTLVELGEKDLAYTLLLQREFPSWLYPVDQGATTVWERWNSYTKRDGFGPVGMNSFNHYAYGAVLGWMYATMAGIREPPDGAGFAHFLLAPVPDRRVGFVKASYRTPYGVIRSEWKYGANGDWLWTYEIPPGTTARVRLPDGRERDEGPGSHTAVVRTATCVKLPERSPSDKSQEKSFVHASWNVGHYCCGVDSKSHLKADQAAQWGADYRRFLKEVGAKTLGLCEYSASLTSDGQVDARETAFGDYPQGVVGKAEDYQWNALLHKGFKCVNQCVKYYPKHKQNVYYVALWLKPEDGSPIVFVQTHLDWAFENGHENDRADQIRTLIDDFKDEKRVVISGDFNVGRRWRDDKGKYHCEECPQEFLAFARAGYQLGNVRNVPTCPSDKPRSPIDNIIVKGVRMTDFKVWPVGKLSDHNLVSARIWY